VKFRAAFIGVLIAFLQWPLFSQSNSGLDEKAFLEIQHWRNPASEKSAEILSGSVVPMAAALPISLGAAAIFRHDTLLFTKALGLAFSEGLALGSALILKPIISRPRPYASIENVNPIPPITDPWSMPSGHTSTAFSTAVNLSLEFPRWQIVLPSLTWAAGAGVSRIILGQHYPGDVIAGAALGSASAWLGWKARKWLNARQSRRSVRKVKT
jgi:undecaprenyl-diphosphatase